jgi:hypothetical protein
MIRSALACEHDHDFEGWFASSETFDEQLGRGQVACPACGSQAVRKQIMAPALSGTKTRGKPHAPAGSHAMMMEAMQRVRDHVEANFDDVGDSFAKEARDIHEGRSEERGIYGQASQKDVRALLDDGVPIAPLPPEPVKKARLN